MVMGWGVCVEVGVVWGGGEVSTYVLQAAASVVTFFCYNYI